MTERKQAGVGADRMQEVLTSIGAHARTTNLTRAEQIDAALTSLEQGILSGAQRDLAVRSAHQLAGSAGTFGLQPASRLASWFERFFGTGHAVEPEDVTQARVHLAELRSRLNDPPEMS